MNLIIKSVFILLFCDQFNRCLCSVWEKSKCSADEEQHMPEGVERNVGRFPWLGIIQHSFMVGDKRAYVITGAVLIHSVYAIAAADDVSKINPDTLANTTELIFWKDSKQKYALKVEDYVLHPEYTQGVTTATIALVSIINPNLIGFSDFVAPVTPVCMPLSGIGTYEDMYAVKFTDVTGDLQKEVIKMNYVGTTECEQFYIESELQYDKMNPTNPLCAVSVNTSSACIWDSGAALITRQSWGFWQLIGFATRGPGCGAPAKFLNIIHYMPWINDIIQSAFSMDTGDEDSDSGENVLGFRRLSPTKLVFYGKSVAHPRYFGACGKEERGRTLYKESARIFCNQPSTGYYLVSVTASASFFCGEVYLRSIARTNAVMWLENHCRRDMEERALFQYRTGDLERIECFLYFKTTAYLEFKFIFALEAEFYVAMYGQYSVPKQVDPFRNPPITTSWWPTWGKISMRYFQREGVANAWAI